MKLRLITAAMVLLAFLPAIAVHSTALSDARALDERVRAISIVGTPNAIQAQAVRGQLQVLPPFFNNLAASLQGVNVGPANEVRSLSLDLGVRVQNAGGETNFLKLAIDIDKNIRPGLERCRALLPSLIAELAKLENSTVKQVIQQVQQLTSTPVPYLPPPPVGSGGTINIPTPLPTPADSQNSVPGVIPPPPVIPPTSNPGLIPPPVVVRPTPTPRPVDDNPHGNPHHHPQPTPIVTPVGPLKAPVAMAMPNHQRFVYVAQVNASSVNVVDTRTRRVIKSLPVGNRPVAMDIGSGGNVVVVTNYDSNNVTIIDGKNHRVMATVEVGQGPVDVAITPDGFRAYVVNQGSNNVSVVMLDLFKVLKTIKVGLAPSRIVMESSGKTFYVSNSQSDTVSIIDGTVNDVVAEIPQ